MTGRSRPSSCRTTINIQPFGGQANSRRPRQTILAPSLTSWGFWFVSKGLGLSPAQARAKGQRPLKSLAAHPPRMLTPSQTPGGCAFAPSACALHKSSPGGARASRSHPAYGGKAQCHRLTWLDVFRFFVVSFRSFPRASGLGAVVLKARLRQGAQKAGPSQAPPPPP